MAKKVVILDYGSGNLRSAERAVARVGADVEVTSDLGKAARADGLVVPGVGAYAACMAGVDALGAAPAIAERVRAGAPVLGICVGMQIMFDAGEEHGVVTKGLGLAPGTVTRLQAPVVPHMGWNTVAWPEGSVLGAGLPEDTRFYFVHSYASTVIDAQAEAGVRVATGVHGEPFVAAFETDVLRATQFHPEKSGDAGATLLANWLGTL
ncbi:imidazole glycerol phosphate synthase subunit HisH [Dactylosporangium sp. NPDC051485]|uniref:imidazole glycerol phosphate synthase subunit HisH n=1 Tax=Dactylosporangium sp. NPDC051485 TaxID=3154846 RepID=UPI00343A60F3